MNLVERVKAILLSPKTEWQAIEGEPGDANYLFTNYVAILAAVPAVAAFLGYSIAGLGIGRALFLAIFLYVVYCAAWYLEVLVINGIVATYGRQKNFPSSLKVAAYSTTSDLLRGICQLVAVVLVLSI